MPLIEKSQDKACSNARSAAVVLRRQTSTLESATSAAEQCGCIMCKDSNFKGKKGREGGVVVCVNNEKSKPQLEGGGGGSKEKMRNVDIYSHVYVQIQGHDSTEIFYTSAQRNRWRDR